MLLTHLSLQHFRAYPDNSFSFHPATTIIIGRNTAGKSNLIEAITMLSTGKSFKTDKDVQLVGFGQDLARIKGKIVEHGEEVLLEIVLSKTESSFSKKFLVNGVPRRRADFASHLPAVLFSPEDLDIIIDGPSLRRGFLDQAIEQVDLDYAHATIEYTKALRQRNALLERARETGQNLSKQFGFWDGELINYGGVIAAKREEFVAFINTSTKDVFDCNLLYDKNIITKERLSEYEEKEHFAGVTLVGPHRDDFTIEMFHDKSQSVQDIKLFGSRGQQRLVMLQLRLLQMQYMVEKKGVMPLLLLDDIFSELDSQNISRIIPLVSVHQTIITTTHKEFVPEEIVTNAAVIELGK